MSEVEVQAPSLLARLRRKRLAVDELDEASFDEVPPSRGAWYFLSDFPRVLPYVRRYWRLTAVSFGMVGVSAAMGLIAPWPLAILLDSVLGKQPLPSIFGSLLKGVDRYTLLVLVVIAGLLVTAIGHGLTVVDDYVNTKLSQRLILDFRSDLFRHVQKLSLAFHDQTATGSLMFRINNQADSIGAITVAIPPLISGVLTLAGMFVIAYRIDTELALLSLTVVPLIYWSAGYYAKRIEPRIYEVQGMESRSLSIVYEAMAMMRVILAFGRESHEYRRFRDLSEQAIDARVKLTVRQTAFSLAVSTITAAGSSLVLGFGAYHVLQHDLTVGELMVVIGYIAAIYQPLEQISHTLSGLQQHFISLRSTLQLLDTEPDVKEAPDALALERADGAVEFERVSFSYSRRERTLNEVSFAVEAGQRVAIVGPTGAGKTTLISLLMRFYDPHEGTIRLDGLDIRKLKLRSLRDQMSVVLQEPLLFSGTIAENIRYGKLDASDEDIVAAARAANAHDFVSRLPSGYSTEIGERGAQLSGGERQRVCVARAFLKDAPILILDEPTSSIDSRTEAVILEALERLMEGRTTFMIAHRLSTIRHADLILVVNQGELVEVGTHEQLVKLDGLYKQLHDVQAARYATGGEGDVEELADTVVGRDLHPVEAAQSHDAVLERLERAVGGVRLRGEPPGSAAWELVAAVFGALDGGSPEALRALAAHRDAEDEELRMAATLAARLVADLDGGAPAGGDLDVDAVSAALAASARRGAA